MDYILLSQLAADSVHLTLLLLLLLLAIRINRITPNTNGIILRDPAVFEN